MEIIEKKKRGRGRPKTDDRPDIDNAVTHRQLLGSIVRDIRCQPETRFVAELVNLYLASNTQEHIDFFKTMALLCKIGKTVRWNPSGEPQLERSDEQEVETRAYLSGVLDELGSGKIGEENAS